MRKHHTKNKGDYAVLKAQVDLFEKGYLVLLPLSEHEDFDLVAYKEGLFKRIQVKYREAVDMTVEVKFETSWSDKNGCHSVPCDKTKIDLYCIYCPQSDTCYYVRPLDFQKTVRLRLAPTKNKQTKHVNLAEHFRDIPPG